MLTAEQKTAVDQLETVFFAHAKKRRDQLTQDNLRLVHYTTAENAINIIRSRTFWMRDTRSMTDFREVEHGYSKLFEYFTQQPGKRDAFCAALDQYHADAGRDALKRYDDWWTHIRTTTYICCFSEHSNEEDSYGRLSMWRAYGSSAGVAMIFKVPDPYSAIPLNVYLSPAAYLESDKFWQELDEAVTRIGAAGDALRGLDRDALVFTAYRMLVMAGLSLKHPAFLEEREWRLIHLPFETPSPHIKSETASIGGIPQVVYKVALENHPAEGIAGITLPELLDRVIIGPTQYPGPIYASLAKELAHAGATDVAEKITFSGIPLRT
ncbi:MAG TPA: DUF2971 domain-containing protein [Stellaceae bacterium]|jgi:hypothetical protein|nr:DUF2971 domain-containing protein [Stellaceae bacterium]